MHDNLRIPATRAGETLVFTAMAHKTGGGTTFLGQSVYLLPDWKRTEPYWRKEYVEQKLSRQRIEVTDKRNNRQNFVNDDFKGQGHIRFKFLAPPIDTSHFVKNVRVTDKKISDSSRVHNFPRFCLALDGKALRFYKNIDDVKEEFSIPLSDIGLQTQTHSSQLTCGHYPCFDVNVAKSFKYRIICFNGIENSSEQSSFLKLQEKLVLALKKTQMVGNKTTDKQGQSSGDGKDTSDSDSDSDSDESGDEIENGDEETNVDWATKRCREFKAAFDPQRIAEITKLGGVPTKASTEGEVNLHESCFKKHERDCVDVTIIAGKDIPKMDRIGHCDPYCLLELQRKDGTIVGGTLKTKVSLLLCYSGPLFFCDLVCLSPRSNITLQLQGGIRSSDLGQSPIWITR